MTIFLHICNNNLHQEQDDIHSEAWLYHQVAIIRGFSLFKQDSNMKLAGVSYARQHNMEEEIVRKVVTRKSCLISRYQQNGHLTSQSESAINLHQPLSLKRTPIKPCMTSTPQQFRRKTIDISEYESLRQRRRTGKVSTYSDDLLENITPIKGEEEKHGVTSLDGSAGKGTSAHGNICGESFDVTPDKSPTQNHMLSLDESILETIDLDSAVKDYWDSQNRNLILDVQGTECENLGSCLEGGGKVINDEIMKSTPQPGAPSSCNVRTQCLKNPCNKCSPLSMIINKHTVPSNSECKDSDTRTNTDLNADFHNTDVLWGNDSLFEDALSSIEEGIASPNSPVLSNMPLGEKIKRALITNVKKPVTPKPKSKQVSEEYVPEINSSNTNEEATRSFVGLPMNVKSLIFKFKGITDLYAWQKECLNLVALRQRKNLVYALPTSGGKTLVAEILILREIICRRKNAIFILPYVAIVQEKVRSLAPFGLELDFFVEEYAAGKGQYPPRKRRRKQSVYVATIEKALGLTNSLIETQRLEELGLFVVDELHLVGDSSGRGSILEGLLTKVMYMQANIQIVGMSATIGNLHEVATFLHAEVYSQDFRPVELKEYIKCDNGLYAVNWTAACPDEFLTLERKLSFSYCASAAASVDPDMIGGLVMEVIPQSSCLVFCPTKKNCENVAQLICSVLPKDLLQHKKNDKAALYRALEGAGNGLVCPVLRKVLPFGLAYHHSGLTADERNLLQEAYQAGTICCVCCTSTLAAGVNLPAKRVILRSPYVGRDFITLSRYKQMIGRAGRAGFGETGESILICKRGEAQKVNQLLSSTMDKVTSSLHMNDGLGIQNLILSAVGLNLATTKLALQELMHCSLLSVQASQLGVDLRSETDRILTELFKQQALTTLDPKQSSPNDNIISVSDCNITVHMLDDASESGKEQNQPVPSTHSKCKRITEVRSETRLTVSRLGKAAIKGCLQLSCARMLYRDLVQAQSGLVLLSCLHLLYLVTPYDLTSQIKPNTAVYFSVYNRLNVKDLKTTHLLGISEVRMARMMSGQTVKLGQEPVLHRFYLTLMLYDLWNQRSVWDVANEYEVPRGLVHNLMTSAAAFSCCVLRFCEELKEFWAFKDLLMNFTQQLSYCCTAELLPLMDLPAVKRGRARQLYKAGYKTLQDVAKADANQMVCSIDHMPKKVANQIIAAAKLLLKQKADTLLEEAQEVLEGI